MRLVLFRMKLNVHKEHAVFNGWIAMVYKQKTLSSLHSWQGSLNKLKPSKLF
jgi:hypothetical protein